MVAVVFAFGTIAVGDLSGKYLAEHQPEKLAAAEWHFETSRSTPLIVEGILDKETNGRRDGLGADYRVRRRILPAPPLPCLLMRLFLFDAKYVQGKLHHADERKEQ